MVCSSKCLLWVKNGSHITISSCLLLPQQHIRQRNRNVRYVSKRTSTQFGWTDLDAGAAGFKLAAGTTTALPVEAALYEMIQW
jgi:hypothetical protein